MEEEQSQAARAMAMAMGDCDALIRLGALFVPYRAVQ